MKKVMFLIPTLGNGGAEKVLVNLVNNMDKSKFDITVICIFDTGVNKDFLNDNIHYEFIFRKQFRGSTQIFKLFRPETLYKHFIKRSYDIIVSYLEGVPARILAGCRNPNIKKISWIHCRIDSKAVAELGFRNYTEAERCYTAFDNTICVSKMTKDYFTQTLSFQKPIEVLYNTIESEQIRRLSAEEIDDVVFSEEYFNICSVGKITEVKGFDRLAKIHKRLCDDGIKNKVYIFGVGDEQKKIEEYLKKNRLEETFMFMGYRVNPYKYVKNADLYVCSSHSEGFSTSVTEALIVGTPVVTTLCSGMQEQLGYHNEYGIVTENNEEDLYKGIKTMLTKDGLLSYYRKQSAERGKKFEKEITVRAVEEMLERI